MLRRVRDVMTGLLVVAGAFGLVGHVLRRPVGPPDDATTSVAPEITLARTEHRAARVDPLGERTAKVITPGSATVIALLGAAPIGLVLYTFLGRSDVPLSSRILVVFAIVALAFATTVLFVPTPAGPRHAAAVVAAISVETAAVIAAIALAAA